jgi:hypothetical protein
MIESSCGPKISLEERRITVQSFRIRLNSAKGGGSSDGGAQETKAQCKKMAEAGMDDLLVSHSFTLVVLRALVVGGGYSKVLFLIET